MFTLLVFTYFYFTSNFVIIFGGFGSILTNTDLFSKITHILLCAEIFTFSGIQIESRASNLTNTKLSIIATRKVNRKIEKKTSTRGKNLGKEVSANSYPITIHSPMHLLFSAML